MTDPINLSPSEIVNLAFRAGITASLTEILHKTIPAWLHQGQPVLVLADTEFGTIDVFKAIHQRQWRAVVGVRDSRTLEDGCSLKQLYRQGKRGQHVHLKGLELFLFAHGVA